jgi:hypothetical protein
VSYFFGVDALDINPYDFLAGDRNMGFNGLALKPGLFTLRTNASLSWTKEMHPSCGYVALADGSVQSFYQSNLTLGVRKQSVDTNRLAFP